MLNAAAARDEAERQLRLTENRRLTRSKAHVARKYELAASAAYPTLDLRDGDETACAQMTEQEPDRRFAGQLRRLLPVLFDPRHIDVGNEIVGVCALEHEYLDGVIGLGPLNEGYQVADQFGPKRFIGVAEISANRTALSLRTLSVSKTTGKSPSFHGWSGPSAAARWTGRRLTAPAAAEARKDVAPRR